VAEPLGGAHRDTAQATMLLKSTLEEAYRQVGDLKGEALLDRRYARLKSYGRFTDTPPV
jgi:acetyl-CoA carboxylase carboxyl transferase subunit alpha